MALFLRYELEKGLRAVYSSVQKFWLRVVGKLSNILVQNGQKYCFVTFRLASWGLCWLPVIARSAELVPNLILALCLKENKEDIKMAVASLS